MNDIQPIMGRHKTPIGIAIDPELLARLDAWREKQIGHPTRTGVIEYVLEKFLSEAEKEGLRDA